MNMKPVNKILLALGVFALTFVSCEDTVEPQSPAPTVSENCQGVYFPVSDAYNNAAYEMEPTETREITLAMSRTRTGEAVEVPLTVVVNDSDVFVVPETVYFGATDTLSTFTVTFPNAEEGITYNLELTVSGDDYVNPYMSDLYVATSVTLIKWESVAAPAVMLDGMIATLFGVEQYPFYVYYEIAELGSGITKYRFLNPFARVPTSVDADGIYDAYPYTETGDLVDATSDYNMIVSVENNAATMEPFDFGTDWGYGMMSGGTIYGYYSTSLSSYPLGVVDGDVITFGASSLYFSMADYSSGGAYVASTPTIIYLTKDAYLAANLVIEDYNAVEYNLISGAISEFSSAMRGTSWDQTFAKAIDLDEDNEDSEYKNLYYLADLYATGYGLAFYYDAELNRLTIPSDQETGLSVFGQAVYMSASTSVASGMTTAANGVETYTFGIAFHYADGTILGDFQEEFYYSEASISFGIDNFCGNFTMTGSSFFGDPDANMSVTIAKHGANNDSLVITGVTYAAEIYASFDSQESIMSIAPQVLADYYGYDMTLYTVDNDGYTSTTLTLDFGVSISGNLRVDTFSNAAGYVLYSATAGGYVDGYYDIVFTPVSTRQAVAKSATKSATSVRAHQQIVMKEKTSGNKLSVQKNRNIYKERKQHIRQSATIVF